MEKINDFYVQVIDLDGDESNNSGIVKRSREVSAFNEKEFNKYLKSSLKAADFDEYFDKITEKISVLSKKIKEKFEGISDSLKPSEIEMQISFALSTEGKLVIISGKFESAFSVKLKWKLK